MSPTYRGLRVVILLTLLLFILGSTFATDISTPSNPIPATYFGLHIHHANAETPWPDMPVPEWRLWDSYVTWHEIEPKKNEFHWAHLDGYVVLAEQHHTGILLPLAMVPEWASAHPPANNCEPANMEDWRNFVKAVVTRYKGRIEAYEIWNEPNLKTFWTGSMEQMIELTKEASQIIHSVDPKAIVVSPSVTATYGVPYINDFLKKGVGQYVDAIGYHFYITPKMPEDLPAFIQSVKKAMADNGLANKPLWNTETGWLEPSHFGGEEEEAGILSRAYILGWAAGLQRFYWYAWDNRHVTVKTTREDKSVSAAGSAYKATEEWLTGAQMNGCSESDGLWNCQITRNGKKQWLVWAPQGNRKFAVPKSWQVTTLSPLVHEKHAINGSSIDIGPAPVLLQ